MQRYEGETKSGLFAIPDHGEAHGDITLQGSNTLLSLTAKEFVGIPDGGSVLGTLHDRTKVSLINCISHGTGSGNRGEERYHFASAFPHFVLFGSQHLSGADEAITSVHFVIDDATTLFYDFDAFGKVIRNRSEIVDAIVKDNAETHPRKIAFGAHPEIFYFTGKHEIFSAETPLGTVSAYHSISYKFPGPEGIHLDNRIVASIQFPVPVSISVAVTDVLTLIRFFEIIVGRPQNVLSLNFRLQSDEEHPIILDAYWCMPPKRGQETGERKPHPADTLLDAAKEPKIFGSVLAKWLERHVEWSDARFRFSSGFSGINEFGIDRLVGAANMFDILPDSALPPPPPLSAELLEAKKKCREEFLKLPNSPERGSILGALGRLGTNTLKSKIRSRAKLISDATGDKFPNLDVVVDEAVNCRNYFVHGTESKISYSENSDFLFFFTETLEFIFAASDLIEAGWNISEWIGGGTTMSHPFGRYRVNYPAVLNALLAELERSREK